MSIARIVYLYCDGDSDRCDCVGGDPYLLQPVPGEDTATSQRADAKASLDWTITLYPDDERVALQ